LYEGYKVKKKGQSWWIDLLFI